jgi:hypothetical protein
MKFGTYLGRLRRLTEPDFYLEGARYAKNSCLKKTRDFKNFCLEAGRDLKNWTCWKFSYEPHGSLAAYLEDCGIGGFFGHILDRPHLFSSIGPLIAPVAETVSYPYILLLNGMSHHLYEIDSTVGFCGLTFLTVYGLAELDERLRRLGKKFNQPYDLCEDAQNLVKSLRKKLDRLSKKSESVQLEPSPDTVKENSEEGFI